MQAAMNTHLSQSIGAGTFEGQHGISPAISSDVADIDKSSAIADVDASAVVPAMTGRDSGATASPAMTDIASNRAMRRRKTMLVPWHGKRKPGRGAASHMR